MGEAPFSVDGIRVDPGELALGRGDVVMRIEPKTMAVLEALAERRQRDAASIIIPLLEDPNKLVALKAVDALGSIGGQAAFRSLLELLNGEDQELQAAAEESINRIQEAQGEDA